MRANDTSATVIGTTSAQVHANFKWVIWRNLASPQGAARLGRLSGEEVQDLAYAYVRNGGASTDLSRLAGIYAPSLWWRVRSSEIQAETAVSGANPLNGARMKLGASPAPNIDMTLQEIYLEFRTAPVGSLSVEASLWEATTFALTKLSGAFGTGVLIGEGVHWLIETYDPALDDGIGGLLDQIMIEIADNSLVPGVAAYWEGMLNDFIFGVPLDDLISADGLGDFGLFDAVDFDALNVDNGAPLDQYWTCWDPVLCAP